MYIYKYIYIYNLHMYMEIAQSAKSLSLRFPRNYLKKENKNLGVVVVCIGSPSI